MMKRDRKAGFDMRLAVVPGETPVKIRSRGQTISAREGPSRFRPWDGVYGGGGSGDDRDRIFVLDTI